MDQALKSRWVAALRSGEYKQATGVLKSAEGRGFCCIGVLCDVVAPEGWETHSHKEAPWNPDSSKEVVSFENPVAGSEQGVTLNADALARFGMSMACLDLLVEFNDSQGKNFSQIADWIDAHDLDEDGLYLEDEEDGLDP